MNFGFTSALGDLTRVDLDLTSVDFNLTSADVDFTSLLLILFLLGPGAQPPNTPLR